MVDLIVGKVIVLLFLTVSDVYRLNFFVCETLQLSTTRLAISDICIFVWKDELITCTDQDRKSVV